MLTLPPTAMTPSPQTPPTHTTTTTTATSTSPHTPPTHAVTATTPIKTTPPAGYTAGGKEAVVVMEGVMERKVKLKEAHSRVFDAFSRAFSRQNVQFEKGKCTRETLAVVIRNGLF